MKLKILFIFLGLILVHSILFIAFTEHLITMPCLIFNDAKSGSDLIWGRARQGSVLV